MIKECTWILFCIILQIIPIQFNNNSNGSVLQGKNSMIFNSSNNDFDYSIFDKSGFYYWKNVKNINTANGQDEIAINAMSLEGNGILTDITDSFGYNSHTYKVSVGNTIKFETNINNPGLYDFSFDYYSLTENILPIKYSLKVNDDYQYDELNQLYLPTFWKYDEITKDRYGNELGLNQTQYKQWKRESLNDTSGLNNNELVLFLQKGRNKIEISVSEGKFLLGNIYIAGKKEAPIYEQYAKQYLNIPTDVDYIPIEAEAMTYKNNANIQIKSSDDVNASPNVILYDKINVIDGNTFNNSNDEVTYKISIKKDGMYKIAIKSLQDKYIHKKSYAYVKINDQIPFKEASLIPISSSNTFENNELTDKKFYLKKGDNYITIGLTSSNIKEIYLGIKQLINVFNTIGLDIIQLTGNNSDKNRDWELISYFPSIVEDFTKYKQLLEHFYNQLRNVNDTKKDTQDMQCILNAIKNIDKILNDINKLPYRLSLLNKDSNSITYYLSQALEVLNDYPLTLDKIYIYEDNIPKAKNTFFQNSITLIKRFFANLFSNKYDSKRSHDEIEIWVERPRQYVDIMQMITDSNFTNESGIKVKFSVLSDESKLLLANASNKQPDIAMNINAFLPYQYAIREALCDFTEFSDYKEVFKNFYYQSYIQYIYNDGIYAVPETQNFQVMFYREDVLKKLKIDVPKSWDDVIGILPQLQRNGMNFYTPLSANTSFKIFNATLPFLLQRNANIYTADGLSPNLDTKEAVAGMSFMCDLFNIYSMPTEIGNFYYEFRNATLPIGIGDFNTYVQLTCAAPEIANLWKIALFPGTNINGNLNSYTTGLSQPIVMFKKSNKKNSAWKWIKWWMEESTQLLYEELLAFSYGNEYMWNSANIQALEKSLIDENSKEIIIKQIYNLKNITMVPGYYMMEREISNIWNNVVLNGRNVRDSIDEAMITIGHEMNKKNIEFGYIDKNYNIIKPYKTDVESFLKKEGLIQ